MEDSIFSRYYFEMTSKHYKCVSLFRCSEQNPWKLQLWMLGHTRENDDDLWEQSAGKICSSHHRFSKWYKKILHFTQAISSLIITTTGILTSLFSPFTLFFFYKKICKGKVMFAIKSSSCGFPLSTWIAACMPVKPFSACKKAFKCLHKKSIIKEISLRQNCCQRYTWAL